MIGIEIERLSRIYRLKSREVVALDAVSTTIPPGQFTAIVGYSGCGKTTLLRVVAGLEKPDRGQVSLNRIDGKSLNAPRIGMVFQDHRLLPWLSVRENIALATRRLSASARSAGRLAEVIEMVGLEGFADALPGQLSGGMAQRAALARALVRDPDILLMDEPFGALDALTRSRLQDELERIWLARRMSVLFVTHDVSEAVRLADHVIVMADGKIRDGVPVALGRPRDPLDPAFLGPRNRVMATILGNHTAYDMEEREHEISTDLQDVHLDTRGRDDFGVRRASGG